MDTSFFPLLPDRARVWLFATDRAVPPAALDAVNAFLPTWASHGRPVQAEAAIAAERVLAIAALISPEELNAGVSGCGIDAMTHAVEAALSASGAAQVAPLAVTYRDASGSWLTVARPAFRALAKNGDVDSQTLVLDLTPTDLGALRARGVVVAAAEAWHGRAFGLSVPA